MTKSSDKEDQQEHKEKYLKFKKSLDEIYPKFKPTKKEIETAINLTNIVSIFGMRRGFVTPDDLFKMTIIYLQTEKWKKRGV